MKILLAYKSGRPGAGDHFARRMPVGLGWINATLRRAGYESSLANLSGVSWSAIAVLLRRERPTLLGITLYTFNRHAGLRLAGMARRLDPDCVVIVGGPHATHEGASILRNYPGVSAVGLGEGEITMLEVARALSRNRPLREVKGLLVRGTGRARDAVVATGPREPIARLDALPFPAPFYGGYHIDAPVESSFVITSRGCPARCTFCNTPDFWGARMRFRGPDHMLAELRYLRNHQGILRVSIRDDTFTVHRRRVIEFCRKLIASRMDLLWNCQSRVNAIDEERLAWMRRAGCDHIQYGIESGSPYILSRLAKDITIEQIETAARATRAVGMTLSVYLISGVPGETKEDRRATASLIERIRPHDGMVSPLALFPGTRIHDEMKAAGHLDEDYWVHEPKDTIYLQEGVRARRSFRRLSRLCARVGRSAAYTREELEAHKRLLPDAYTAWLASGDAYEACGEVGAAIGEYERILAFSPANVWALARLGRILLESGDPDGAAIYLTQARDAVPRSSYLRALLRAARHRSGEQSPGEALPASPS